MSKEYSPRVTQQEVGKTSVQLEFDEVARKTPRGIEIVSRENFGHSRREPFKPAIDNRSFETFGKSAWETIPQLYSQGKNGYEIADELGTSPSSVYEWLRKTNTPRRPKGRFPSPVEAKIQMNFGQPAKEFVRSLYDENHSPSEIARITETSEQSIINLLRRAGATFRTRSEAQKVSWEDEKVRKERIKSMHSPEAKKRRVKSVKRFYSTHPEKLIDGELPMIKGGRKRNAELSREKRNLVKKALGVRSNKDLTIKLRSLYDELGTIKALVTWFEQRDSPVSHTTVRKILKSLEIEVKQVRVTGSKPKIDEEDMQLVLRADINSIFLPDLAEVMQLRFLSKLSLREIAKRLKISHETVRSKVQEGLKMLKGLGIQDLKPLVDS